jgi:hypothetical protein
MKITDRVVIVVSVPSVTAGTRGTIKRISQAGWAPVISGKPYSLLVTLDDGRDMFFAEDEVKTVTEGG